MQTLTLTLAANQTVAFDIAGSYFEIIDSVGLVSVNFYDASGSRTKDLELQRVLSGFYVKGRFSRFEIQEASGSAQSITVLYGSTEGGTRRSPGNVRIIDQSVDQTRAGGQYLFIDATSNAVNGQISGVRSSSKSLLIRSFKFTSDSACTIQLFTGTAAPTTITSSGAVPLNKLIASTAPTAQISRATAAGFPISSEVPGIVTAGYFSVQAGLYVELPLKTPLVVPPGYFFGLANNAANKSVAFLGEFEEFI